MICPNCKSEGSSRLKLQDGNPIDVRLKEDKRLYSQIANIVQCPECKDTHLLTQEYTDDGKVIFCEREYGFFQTENPLDEPKIPNLYIDCLDRIVEFKYNKKYKKHVQFTGMNDCKDVKIYEGDKVNYNDKFLNTNGYVKWSEENLCFIINFDDKSIYSLLEQDKSFIKIISEERW